MTALTPNLTPNQSAQRSRREYHKFILDVARILTRDIRPIAKNLKTANPSQVSGAYNALIRLRDIAHEIKPTYPLQTGAILQFVDENLPAIRERHETLTAGLQRRMI